MPSRASFVFCFLNFSFYVLSCTHTYANALIWRTTLFENWCPRPDMWIKSVRQWQRHAARSHRRSCGVGIYVMIYLIATTCTRFSSDRRLPFTGHWRRGATPQREIIKHLWQILNHISIYEWNMYLGLGYIHEFRVCMTVTWRARWRVMVN